MRFFVCSNYNAGKWNIDFSRPDNYPSRTNTESQKEEDALITLMKFDEHEVLCVTERSKLRESCIRSIYELLLRNNSDMYDEGIFDLDVFVFILNKNNGETIIWKSIGYNGPTFLSVKQTRISVFSDLGMLNGDKYFIDNLYLARCILVPRWISTQTVLMGVQEIIPLSRYSCDYTTKIKIDRIWNPIDCVGRKEHNDNTEVDRTYFRLVCDSLHNLIGKSEGALIALSGGLDSSSVASTLRYCFPDFRFEAYTVLSSGIGDELRYAIDVAKHNDMRVRIIDRNKSQAMFYQQPPPIKLPVTSSFNLVKAAYDVECDLCSEYGVDTVFTGQGGDTLFFKSPPAFLSSDRLYEREWTNIPLEFYSEKRWTRLFGQFLGLNKLYPVVVMPPF